MNLATGTIQEENAIFGIDLGTSNSLIAKMIDGKPVAIADIGKTTIVPSIVYFSKDGSILVGEAAKPYLLTEPERTIFSVKRLMGKSYRDIQEQANMFSYQLIEGQEDQLVKIRVGDKLFTPIELSALILKELKQRAEHRLKQEIRQVVITVPAYFNDAQRQATRDAGKLAGLEVLRILNEPTAASLAYGIGTDLQQCQTIAVYDLGGGTFDVTILRLEQGIFEVLSTNGDTYLGGDDFDKLLAEYWLNNLNLQSLCESDPHFKQNLRLTAEEAKKTLTHSDSFEKQFTYQNQTWRLSITKYEFERLISPLIQKTIQCTKQALNDAGLTVSQIDTVILVGGSTRVPAVKEAVKDFFGKKPNDSLNPDEVVALGAAIQADILAGNRKDLLLLDVTPLSLGIETAGGLMDVIIPRNSKIPFQAARQYTTSVDGQVNLRISVYQGERELVSQNRKLGEFELRGIPAMPAGLPKIQVSFRLDADGILSVEAIELRSQIKQTLHVKPSYGLTDQEIEQMLFDSLQHAQEDFETRLLLEAKQEAKQVLYHAQKFLEKNQFLLSDSEIEGTQKHIISLQKVLQESNRHIIQQAIERLNEFTKPFAERIMDLAIQQAMVGKKIQT
ncbi:MAG: Fe-S protein assembly chaperone HscA [Bacteroidia bacterium]|nr:Fe-S protein assembly chaperone HscA [Bacteroidia bacterium]